MTLPRKHNLLAITLTLLVCLSVAWGQGVPVKRSEHFIAYFPKGREHTAEFFLKTAEAARAKVNGYVANPVVAPIRLIYCPTERDFLQASGLTPEHFLACAVPQRRSIYINGDRLRPLNPNQVYSVLVHEYAHIHIGLRAAAPLPRWLDEGLAMHLSDEWTFGNSLRLSAARFLGKFIPFSRLEQTFPSEQSALHLAYLQSYSLTDFIIKRFFGGSGLKGFLRRLSDPREGTRIIEQLRDPIILKSIEEQWKTKTGGWWRNTLFLVTSGTTLWFALASFFIYAYLKKRKQQKEQIKIWEEEEQF